MGWYGLSDAHFGVFKLLKVNTQQNVSYTWPLCVFSRLVLFLTSSNNLGSAVHQYGRASASPLQEMKSEQTSNSHIYNVKRISKLYNNFRPQFSCLFKEIIIDEQCSWFRPYIYVHFVC